MSDTPEVAVELTNIGEADLTQDINFDNSFLLLADTDFTPSGL